MKNLVVLDCEVYPNYTLFAFKNIENQKVITFEIKGENNRLTDEQQAKLYAVMKQRWTFGFNSRNYDMCIILSGLRQKTAKEIYNLSNYIIETNSKGWQTMQKFGLSKPYFFEHFDIQEPAPGIKVSLKLYGARLNSKTLKDLPIEPGSILSEEDMENIKLYCINDLDTTIDLYNAIKDRIDLRVGMSNQYQEDLMSKSDAQIAEVVIKKELLNKNPNSFVKAPKISKNAVFKFKAPDFIKFKTPQLQVLLTILNNCQFYLDGKGSIKLPAEIKKTKIKLGETTYQLGIGGLHSKEKSQFFIASENEILVDRDVVSYYPSIILNQGLYPRHLGPNFLEVYKKIVDERIKAKKSKNKIVNESLKIVINGSFGKLGNQYSLLYSPDLMIAVTLTGQLSLLMLIESLELAGIKVVSSNTDGFVSLMNKNQYEVYDTICFDWELKTNFELEELRYKAIFSRDVNNYLAITFDNKTKGKGVFATESLVKNPSADICVESVIKFLIDGTPIADSIKNCKDLTKFLHVRTVNGGAVYKKEYLGRVVRWIYSKKGEPIRSKKKGDKVANSDGARPVMVLNEFPSDIDYDRYIQQAIDILDDLNLNNF